MKTTAEMIEVMQAFERGEAIEGRVNQNNDAWETVSSPGWDWYYYDYRVKPVEKKRVPLYQALFKEKYVADFVVLDSLFRNENEARAFTVDLEFVKLIEPPIVYIEE